MAIKVIIIGAGPGGYVAAVRAAQNGCDVTVIERENVGGTCLNYGCIPSKIMKVTADLYDKFGHSGKFGIELDGAVSVNMRKLMDRKKSVLETQSKGILGLFKHHGIHYVLGEAVIEKEGIVSALEAGGDKQDYTYDKLIIATGTSPLNIGAFPFDGVNILSSDDILSLEAVPESMVIVGGGVIGCEFAFILSALGTKVTLVEAMDRILPLPSVDESCSKIIQREMKKRKIKFYTDQAVEKVETGDDGVRVFVGKSPFSEKTKKPVTIEAEKMAVCIGRSPNSRGIGLDKIGVGLDERGWISVNDRMETSVKGVYAIGDITGPARVMLAHVASTEGEVAVDNLLGAEKEMTYDAVPGGIFTMPEVGNVGLTETQAKDQGYNVNADTSLFRTLGKAQVTDELAGEAKIVSDADTGKILGVHITGPHATDLIAEGTLAITNGLCVKDLVQTIHAHPTLSEIMLEAAFKVDGRALHG